MASIAAGSLGCWPAGLPPVAATADVSRVTMTVWSSGLYGRVRVGE